MTHVRPARQQLVAAVTTVLAVTVGASLATAPAIAATPTAAVGADAGPAETQAAVDGVISIPRTDQVLSVGPSGFLSVERRWDHTYYRWTSTVDGTTTNLPEWYSGYRGGGSDTVVAKEDGTTRYLLHDMSSPGSDPAVVNQTDTRLYWKGVVGRTLVFSSWDSQSRTGQLRLIGEGNQAGSDRQVTGLTPNSRVQSVEALSDSSALVRYVSEDADTDRSYLAVVDVATASVVEKREVGVSAYDTDTALSGDRWVWVDAPTSAHAKLMYATRDGSGSTPAVEAADLGDSVRPHIGVLGDWATYAAPGGAAATEASTRFALSAVNLVDGSTVKLLDHASSTVPATDGALLVRGGTVAHGEGVYRIVLGADGKPTATLIASTGEPTALTLHTGATLPVVDLDKNNGQALLRWVLSRTNAQGSVTVRHITTGRSVRYDFAQAAAYEGKGSVDFRWDGMLPNAEGTKEFAPSGDYAWDLTASPLNGVGPDVAQTGTFKVTRTAGLHDYTDNSTPDLLSRDAAGVLWRDDSAKVASAPQPYSTGRAKVGGGWQIYNQLEAAGNIAGSPAGDLVARDKTGVLWLYQGNGNGSFAGRTKIGGGWQTYDNMTGGSDLDGDGKSDLLATDAVGDAWFYKGTGSTSAPFAPRKKIGWGWEIYNQLTATGDITGTSAGDLVARDRAGVLWLYEGKGDGTYAPRTRIGAGWGVFTHLVGIGDADRDGRADLYAVGTSGAKFYAGTGDTAAPFKPAAPGNLLSDSAPVDSVF
ncbi:FG-GAP repeat domain-containing protein [Streptomyces lancefieldiae]|uniref:VCBS repeat-containing protein n=1 Tax=Streptomyces lancefieldiae TaxID=3075520 RepID=A0ABU3APT3_9ACTN|nr:VCBS repeat-containing protein [Streptomyces sp. DSM 40712]MDT0612184.1 VCBS repeat-containing protein [Streptomyces sp. DSM 40712]